MSTIPITRRIDITALGFEATMSWGGTAGTVTAAGKTTQQLQTAVDAAPLASVSENNQAAVVAALAQAIIDMGTVITDMQNLVASAALPAGASLTTTQLTTIVRALDSAARTTAADLGTVAGRVRQAARLLNGDFTSST